MHRFLFFSLAIFFCFDIKAQNSSIYPDHFSSYFNNFFLTDPSYIPETGTFNMSFSHKSKQISSDLSTFNLHAEKIIRLKNKSVHLFRGIAFNEKEGPYISSPRYYFNYARQLQISQHIFICAGISIGMVGINYFPPSGSGSANLPDGGLGMSLHLKHITTGFSVLQLLNSSGNVLSREVTLARYYNFYLQSLHEINDQMNIKFHSLWRHYSTMKDQWNIGTGIMYNKFIEAGTIYQYQRGTSFFGALQFFPEVNPVYLSFTYNTSFLGLHKRSNDSYEITIKYFITKSDRVE